MKNLRAEMPVVAQFVDELRAVFGTDCINQQIRAGMRGEPAFYARENGIEIGTHITQGDLIEIVPYVKPVAAGPPTRRR